MTDAAFLQLAIDLAHENVITQKGGPFGAVIVKNGEIIAQGTNLVTATNDPSAHAEIVAIRNACAKLNHFQLTDCVIYSSCEPCPMCFGAIFWARPKALFYAATAHDAAHALFDDAFIYAEINKAPDERSIPFIKLTQSDVLKPFQAWKIQAARINY